MSRCTGKGLRASIIVPIYNGLSFLPQFWDSLSGALPDRCEIIAVDDGSTQHVAETIPSELKSSNFSLFRNDYSVGYAGAINTAASKASGQLLILLNTDLILDAFSLKKILSVFDTRTDLGILGAKLIYPQTGTIQHVGVAFAETHKTHFYRDLTADHPLVTIPREVQAATFALVAIPKSVWEEVGPLNERYFNRNEDIDFCLRAREFGYKILVHPSVRAYHWESLSGRPRFALSTHNEARFWTDWGQRIDIDIQEYLLEAWDFHFHDTLFDTATWAIVDLSKSPVGSLLLETVRAKFHGSSILPVHRFRQLTDSTTPIDLLLALPQHILHSSRSLLLLTDSCRQLRDNNYWRKSRARKGDMIVDHNSVIGWNDTNDIAFTD